VRLAIDPHWGVVELTFSEESPVVPRARRLVGEPEQIELSGVHVEARDDERLGLRRGDVVGSYVLDVPDESDLSAVSIEYATALHASDEQLRAWFADRAVIIGNARRGIDLHPHPGNRRVYGCYAHATAIDALDRAATVRFPRPWQINMVLLGAAAIGGVIAVGVRGSAWRRGVLLGGVAVVGVVVSVLAYRQTSYLFAPIVPALAMVVAALLAQRIVRLRAVPA
jgi:hypothetical protein